MDGNGCVGGHGSGMVGGRASTVRARLRSCRTYPRVLDGLSGSLVLLGELWWSTHRQQGPYVDGYG